MRIDIEPEDFGYIRKEEVPDMEHLHDHVVGVLNALYETGDMKSLEFCLEEVCAELNVPFPRGPHGLKGSLQYHLGYQRGVLDQIENKGL